MTAFSDPSVGVAPSQEIRALIESGGVGAERAIDEAQIQPASLDLRLGARAWRLRASFLPGARARVADRLADFAMHQIDLTNGAVLETGCVYLVELQEFLALPSTVSAIANAKSSTGRLDLFTRLITDHGAAFDHVAAGYHGPLFAEISPRAFSVLARAGARLNQIRFRVGATAPLSDEALRALQAEVPLVDGEARIDQGLAFSVDLSPKDGPIGYRARRHAPLIDLDGVGAHDPAEYWEPIQPSRHARLILDPGAFYILASRESVRTPPTCAAEMQPYSAMIGEFRVHYAGFFDPGFGMGDAPARGVLEVRCHETPFVLDHGQIVGRLLYEPMRAPPDKLYGPALGSHYAGQGLKLSKHFRAG